MSNEVKKFGAIGGLGTLLNASALVLFFYVMKERYLTGTWTSWMLFTALALFALGIFFSLLSMLKLAKFSKSHDVTSNTILAVVLGAVLIGVGLYTINIIDSLEGTLRNVVITIVSIGEFLVAFSTLLSLAGMFEILGMAFGSGNILRAGILYRWAAYLLVVGIGAAIAIVAWTFSVIGLFSLPGKIFEQFREERAGA